MIRQIVKSEKELIKLIKRELNSREESNNQHQDNTEKEIQDMVDEFFEIETPEKYPVYMFADFTFIYHGFDIDLVVSSTYYTDEDFAGIRKDFEILKDKGYDI